MATRPSCGTLLMACVALKCWGPQQAQLWTISNCVLRSQVLATPYVAGIM